MRNSVLRDRSLMRWADGPVRKGTTTRFFIPPEYRLHTSGQKQTGVETRDSHPIYEIDKSVEVDKEESQRLDSSPTHNLHSEPECGAHLHTKAPDLPGVSLSPPSLNGQTAIFWQIVRDNPAALPSQIANKLHVATGRNLTGAQVKALIAAGPSVIGPNDGFI